MINCDSIRPTMREQGSPHSRGNITFLLSRPLALLASLGFAAFATFALWTFLTVAADLHQLVQNSLLAVAFALFWYATWKYLMRARSVGAVRARSRVVAKVMAVGVASLIGLWVVGIADGDDFPDTALNCTECRAIAVTRVIDGDTLVSGLTRIRLYGIDAPEVGEHCADGATERLKDLAGNQVRIEPGPRPTDVHGRTLGYLYTVDGASIDEVLVAEGRAVAWTRDGQHREFLIGLEGSARSGGIGCLW